MTTDDYRLPEAFSGYQLPDAVREAEAQPEAPDPGDQRQRMRALRELGTFALPAVRSPLQTLTIVGQIEGHLVLPSQNKTTKYEHVIPQLVALEQHPSVDGVLIIVNTVGGDVEAGLAIAEMIASLSKPTVSLVLGGGHSIGVPIVPLTRPPIARRDYVRGPASSSRSLRTRATNFPASLIAASASVFPTSKKSS